MEPSVVSPSVGLHWKYVEVESVTRPDGSIVPKVIVWDDGRMWRISKVVRVERNGLEAGVQKWRYKVRIGKHETWLFYDVPRWHVILKSSPTSVGNIMTI